MKKYYGIYLTVVILIIGLIYAVILDDAGYLVK